MGRDKGLYYIPSDLCLRMRLHVDEFAAFLSGSKHHHAVNKSVDSVILAHAYVEARMMHRAALAFDDVSCSAVAAAENFNAEAFAL